MSSKRLAVTLSPLLALSLAAPAGAANRYIDDSGTDAGACQSAAAPCKTITYALGVGDSTDTYLVGGGTYMENVTIGASASLISSDFKPPATAGAAIVDGGTGVGITSSTSGQIRDLTVRGDQNGIVVNDGSPTITHDVFDDPHTNNFGRVDIKAPASANLDASTFLGGGHGVYSQTSGPVTVAGSTFEHVISGVETTQANSITVRDNVILVQGVKNVPIEAIAVAIQNGTGSILRNRITGEQPGGTEGIYLYGGDITLHANRVQDANSPGIEIQNPSQPITMDSDVIVHNSQQGISGIGAAMGLIRLTNETIVDNSGPGQVATDGPVSIDSSIIGAGGVSAAGGCTITYSRGPTTAGNSCQRFQTSANPRFVSATNFHLLPSSPLIDAGNPMAPPAGALDADGRPRALDGNRDCVVRRDMGAFELPAKPCVRPKCKLKPKSSQVSLATGAIKLRARCNQKVRVTLTGTVKVKQHGKTKSLALGPLAAKLKRNVAKTLKLKLPKAARQALANGATESARFKLIAKNFNGATGTAKARIKHLTAT